DAAVIKEITSTVSLPVNIVGNINLAAVEALGKAGVKRISMAVFMYRATYHHLEQIAKNVLTTQSLAPLF
ncbi:MAG: isocitrate lyase/phosphoenolpyruvate mutase family protein, partial [Mucilaginibacter sp.]